MFVSNFGSIANWANVMFSSFLNFPPNHEKGETASSHLAGITVDIQRRGMTRQQVAWVEQYMMPLRDQGLVEPEEERHQWVFHVAVSGHYADLRESKMLAGEQQDEAQDDKSWEPPTISAESNPQP